MSQKQPKLKKNTDADKNIEPSQDHSSAAPKPLFTWGLDPVKQFEQLIAHWYQMAINVRVEELHVPESLNEPLGATSSASFSTGNSSTSMEVESERGVERSPFPLVLAPQEQSEPESQAEKPWRWSLIWLSILGVFGGLGTAALVWLTSLPPLPNCQQLSRLTTDGEVLYCAQQAAESGQLPKIVSSIETLKQWGSDHPLHTEASRLIDAWSARILVNARIKMRENDAKGAIEAIKHIPQTSSVYADGQEIVNEWRQQWQKGKDIFTKAQTAMKDQKWDDVSVHILALSKFDNDYWSTTQTNVLAQQLGVERQARQALVKAQKLAKSGTYKGIGEAITLAQKVPAKTYAGAEAKTNLNQWSQTLLTAGLQQWSSGDRGGAISTLYVAPSANVAPELHDLVLFGNAYVMVNSTHSNWVPADNQIWNLMEAIAAIKQVKANSPFHGKAQAHLKEWQASLKDIIQVKYASMTAGMGQHSMLKLAIDQARQVPTGNPRRIQAQTLIAYWTQEVERIEDEPLIVRAQQLAQSGKIPDLKAAIAQATKIQLGRSMRGQAQDWIAIWRSQIEVIEDQPILAQAEALGQEGKLDEAINTAAQIKEGRALYTEAQAAIWNWRAEQIRIIQIAQDQPILNRARSLAASGSLSAAIDVAAQIGPGRALYYEAQGSIGAWQEELRPVYTPPAAAEEYNLPSAESAPGNGEGNSGDNSTSPEGYLDGEAGNGVPSSDDSGDKYTNDGYSGGGYSGSPEDAAPPSAQEGAVPESMELTPAEPQPAAPIEPAVPINEPPPVVESMPMEEILPQSSIEAPPPIYEAPQSVESVPFPQAIAPIAPVSPSFAGYYGHQNNSKPVN